MKSRNSTSCTKKTRPEIVLIIKLAKGDEEEEEEEKGEKEGGARVCAGRNVLCNVGQGKPPAACLG